MKRAVDAIFSLWRRVLDEPVEEVVLRLSLLLLLLHGVDGRVPDFLLRLCCLPMLFARSLLTNRWLWTAAAAICIGSTYSNWFGQDNHKFLITYWAIACCLAVWSRDTPRVLAMNARLLVALAFTFAVFWKVFSGDFLSGKYFEYVFTVDSRFETFSRALGGTPRGDLGFDRELTRLLRTFPSESVAGALRHGERLPLVAVAMAWLTVLIEGAVAAAFWLRFRLASLDAHNWLLIAFCVTTYALAPVVGFGFLLVTMGYAQCSVERRDTRQAYLWTFLIVQFAVVHNLNMAGALFD